MPDEPTDETTTTDEAEQPDKDWKAEADKWKALARKHEAQAKSNAAAAQRVKELEDADKTESQKAIDRAAAAEKRAADAEAKALRLEIAAEKGLTPSQAKRLMGANREELEADADELMSAFKPADPKTDDARRPKEKLRPGASSEDSEGETDPKTIAEQVLSSP
jgi:hypothetical protein